MGATGGEHERASAEGGETVVYCLIPRALAGKLHEPLRRHFADRPDVSVVVERRGVERRALGERRSGAELGGRGDERRRIRGEGGRRVGDRRAPAVPVASPALPRRFRRYEESLAFVERLEPGSREAEDRETARLVTRIQSGDTDAFAEIYMRYFDRVYGYVLVVMRDSHEAEDATQQIFSSVFEALPRYERRAQPFRAWLFTIVRHQAIRQLKRQGRMEPLDPSEIDRRRIDAAAEPEFDALDWISDRELVMFVERLPLAQRQVLVMRFLLGLTTREIADVLDRQPDDVRALQSRGLRFLRARLSAVGRGPTRFERGPRMRRRRGQAVVLRSRRFALLK